MKRSPLVPIFLIVLVDVLGLIIIIPLLPIYAEKLGASPFTAGLLISVYGFCQLIAGPIMGQLSDRMGRKPLLLASQAGTFVGFLILAFSTTLWHVFLSRIIDGLTAGNIAVAQAHISDVTEPKNRAKAFGLVGIAFGVGFLLGPAVTGFLAQFGYKWPIFAAAGLSATSILATSVLLKPAKKSEAATATPAGETPRRKMPMRVFFEALFAPKLGPLLWQFLAFTFAFSMFISGFPLFAERRLTHDGRPFDVQHIGYVLAFMGLVGVIIQGGFLGKLVTKFGEKRLIVSGLIAMVIGNAAIAWVGTVPPLLMAILGLSFGASVVRPAITSLVTQTVPSTEQGMAIGMTQAIMSVAQILAPMVGGALIQKGLLAGWALAASFICVIGTGLALSNRRV